VTSSPVRRPGESCRKGAAGAGLVAALADAMAPSATHRCRAGHEGGKHQPRVAIAEQLPVVAQRVAGLLVERDGAPAGLGLGTLQAGMPSSRTLDAAVTGWGLRSRRPGGWSSRSTSWPWPSDAARGHGFSLPWAGSTQQCLQALIAGQRNPKVLAQLARAGMRSKIAVLAQALTGHFDDHHGFLCQLMLERIDAATVKIDQVTAQIDRQVGPFAHQVAQLDAITGVGVVAAPQLIAEIGVEMGRFPTAAHLASWAKFAPTSPPVRRHHQTRHHRPGQPLAVRRRAGWVVNQKVLYDAKRHTHTAQGLAVSTIWGDLLWVDGGWPGSCHEHELLALAGLDHLLDDVEVASLLDRGFRGLAKGREHWHAPVGDRRTKDRLSDAQRAYNRLQAGLRALVEQSIAHLAGAWALRRWRGLLYRARDVYRAAGALVCLGRWLHRVPT
jgi:DDE superfamily endonuclease/Transposase IS116/IS110/IS902 family